MPKSRKPMKRSRLKPRKRSASEFARIYGSRQRVEWVKAQPCIACRARPSENAHIVTGGIGRKADAELIVPMCPAHHYLFHTYGRRWFEESPLHLDLHQAAAETESAWQSHISNNQESPK